MADRLAYWYRAPDRPLRVVAVDPPGGVGGGRKRQAFYCTLCDATAEQVLTWYALRWSAEVASHDAKGHLGFEQPQGWSEQAARRTAPVATLGHAWPCSCTRWWCSGSTGTGTATNRHYRAPDRPWYVGKARASFADMPATLRCRSVAGASTRGFLDRPSRSG